MQVKLQKYLCQCHIVCWCSIQFDLLLLTAIFKNAITALSTKRPIHLNCIRYTWISPPKYSFHVVVILEGFDRLIIRPLSLSTVPKWEMDDGTNLSVLTQVGPDCLAGVEQSMMADLSFPPHSKTWNVQWSLSSCTVHWVYKTSS